MHGPDIQTLNEKFGVSGRVVFREKVPGIVVARIACGGSTADISLYGAHVLSFRPSGGTETIFLSKQSHFEPGKAIRGGIPLCWPWFGPHPSDANQPLHGFLRLVDWNVEAAWSGEKTTEISLVTASNEITRARWPHEFRARLDISVGEGMSLELTTQNTDSAPWVSTGAFHPYFRVGDIAQAEVEGLDGVAYQDRLPGGKEGVQKGAVVIQAETNRIYGSGAPKTIMDRKLGRRIAIEQWGCPSTLVWNPWIERSREMVDFGDEEYLEMLCVESVRSAPDAITIEPGESASFGFSFRSADIEKGA
ncbi:MAG: D-hexose-6-phosphate mutarotase [Rectinemataceae bacterium]